MPQNELGPPLSKESIMVLTHVMIASETRSHLSNPKVINYLLKSVFELVEQGEDNYKMFTLEDVAALVDAFYKS